MLVIGLEAVVDSLVKFAARSFSHQVAEADGMTVAVHDNIDHFEAGCYHTPRKDLNWVVDDSFGQELLALDASYNLDKVVAVVGRGAGEVVSNLWLADHIQDEDKIEALEEAG